jgi:hypothetical protein
MRHIFAIIRFIGQEDETSSAKNIMIPSSSILPLMTYMILLLAATSCGLAASGHFPNEHRAPSLRTAAGMSALIGSLAVAGCSLILGTILVWPLVPWFAFVIGAGGVLLATPLLLRPLSDQFVNGRAVLIILAGVSAGMAIFLYFVAGD